MVAVQAEGCAPVIQAFQDGAQRCEFWQGARRSPPVCGCPNLLPIGIPRNLHQSHGTAVAVSDAEITQAQQRLARLEGIFAAPEGAATLAALEQLLQQGWVHPHERIVLFIPGLG